MVKLMRRVLGWTTIAVLMMGGVAVSCSKDDSSSATTTTAKSSSDSGSSSSSSGSGSGSSAVDDYCKKVEELTASAKEAMKDPMNANTADLSKKSQELSQDASKLAAEVRADPSQAKKLADCSQKAAKALTGG
jgi:hypothetical protein